MTARPHLSDNTKTRCIRCGGEAVNLTPHGFLCSIDAEKQMRLDDDWLPILMRADRRLVRHGPGQAGPESP